MASASAVYEDLNAWDANNVKHANRGEDFNVGLLAGTVSAVTRGDVNSDYNYLVVLRYTPPGSTSNTYVDLNVKVVPGTVKGASYNGGKVDANVVVVDLNTVDALGTPCERGGDYNVIQFGPGDFNTFNVVVSVPQKANNCSTCSDMNQLVGREVTVELWPLIQDASLAKRAACGTAPDANSPFIIGPAIIAVTPNESDKVARIKDQNITIMGFGFAHSSSGSLDNNVRISVWDANGTELTASTVKDMNVLDVTHTAIYKYHRSGFGDTNDFAKSLIGAAGVGKTVDWNALSIHPDANGEFDVNITIPYVSASAGGTIGRTDLNTIRANQKNVNIDVNLDKFIIAPNITEPVWMDVNVVIGSVTYSLNDAIGENRITNYGAVSGYQVAMGFEVSSDGKKSVVVKFNEDVNLRKGPTRNYGTDMNARVTRGAIDLGIGDVEIKTDNMPEFEIDANIYMYNVKMPTGEMPFISKDGIACAISKCKNQDGTALLQTKTDGVTGIKTWDYGGASGDGNFAFRVDGFSKFELTTLTATMTAPNGGEKIRVPRHNADVNYRISFTFRDLNTQDNNIAAVVSGYRLQAIIYYADLNGADLYGGETGIIINDTNLYDSIGIRCNGFNNFTWSGSTAGDVNLATEQTCVYDMNRADVNKIFGEYKVDVNVMAPGGTDLGLVGKTVTDPSDQNVFFNPPLIEITDLNLNTENFTIDDLKDSIKYADAGLDMNYNIDFNIYLPDANTDQNISLRDYNIHFYISETTRGGLTSDLNMGTAAMIDQNFEPQGEGSWVAGGTLAGEGIFIKCTEPRANRGMDYNCIASFDTNGVKEGKYYLDVKIFNNTTQKVFNKHGETTLERTLDINEMWDINSSTYAFSINDGNLPRASVISSSLTVAGTSYTVPLICDDNTSGAWKYWFKLGSGLWNDYGSVSNFQVSTSGSDDVTYIVYGGCTDYANNSSDINATVTITLQPGTTRSPSGGTPGGGPGGGISPPTITPGTEIILEKSLSKKPTSEEIVAILTEAGASQNAIDKAGEAVGKTTVTRDLKVEKITDDQGNVTYKTTITMSVRNKGAKSLRNVKIIEKVLKSVAASASEISSLEDFKVLKEDPIIEFTLASIGPSATKEITYSVDAKVTEAAANAWTFGPITAALEEVAPCEGITCPDEVCKTGACNPGTEMCEYTAKANGTSCGQNMECQAGECIAVTPPAPAPPADYTTWIVIAIVAVLAAGGGYYYYTKYYTKSKPMGK